MNGNGKTVNVGVVLGGDSTGAKHALNETAQGLGKVTDAAQAVTAETKEIVAATESAAKSSDTAAPKVVSNSRKISEAARDAAIETKEVSAATAAIGRASDSATPKVVANHRKISDGVTSISTQLAELKVLTASWLAAQQAMGAAKGLADIADGWANLQAKLKLAVGEGPAFEAAFSGVREIAMRTNSVLDTTATLFAKLVEANKQLPPQVQMTQVEILRLTETVNQAAQLSGEGAEATNAAIRQLIQGLQSGTLRGDEFNSVMEQAPRLAKAMADGLGVPTGKLKEMAESGQLTAEAVITAVRGQAAVIEQEFGKLPLTIGRAVTDLSTQWNIWVGKTDESAGASKSAAQAIELLAKNLDFVAASLINAGQAYLGWKAYNIAAEFLSLRTAVAASAAAKVTDTAATTANTVATQANTAAQLANNAAKRGAAGAADGAAAGAGRLAGALSTVKGVGLAFLLTNLVDIGKWLGESVAKWQGYDEAVKNAEMRAKAEAAATRAQADEKAALAQKMKIAEEAALGLNERSRALIASFEESRKKGEALETVIEKLGKTIDATSIEGIRDAGTALDVLAQKGKISAGEIQDAWGQALKGQDLQAFEVNARAAFDGSAQGARRLADALLSQLSEALNRTKLDAGALAGQVNDAAQTALNDFDVLAGRINDIKASGYNVGIALAASLAQATAAATTEAAAKEVIARWDELGKQGLVTGEKLEEGLEKARRKLDDLSPGVTSVEEAFRTLGMKTPDELRKVSASAKEAFDVIAAGSDGSARAIANTREAWRRYAEAAIAANGGVADVTLRAQAGMQGYEIAVDGAGKAVVRLNDAHRSTAGSAGGAAHGIKGVADAAAGAKGSVDAYRESLERMAAAQAAADQRGVQGGDGVWRNAYGQHVEDENGKVLKDKNGNAITNSTSILDMKEMQGRKAPVDVAGMMYRRGGTIEEVKAAMAYYGELYQRGAAQYLTGNLGNQQNTQEVTQRVTNDSIDEALRLARVVLAGGKVDMGTSLEDQLRYNLSKINYETQRTSYGGMQAQQEAIRQAGMQASKTVRIELADPAGTIDFHASEDNAEALVKKLQKFGRTAA